MTRPTVLFFLADFGGGGAQRTIINLAKAMPSDQIDVQLVVGDARGPAKNWLDPEQDFIDLQCRRTRTSFFALSGLVRRIRPDAVLSTMIHANITAWLAARLGCLDAAMIVRETNSHRAQPDLGVLERTLPRLVYPKTDLVIALSEGVRNELLDDMVLRKEQVVTIPNPVAVAAIDANVRNASRRPAPWAGEASGPRILAAGRLVRQKAFEVLLDSVAGLGPNVHLVILGEGPDRDALNSQAQSLGIAERVAMPGFVEDTAPYYAHADVFALSSRWEGFGHVIVEAMAAGLPVVATDCPYGPADIIVPGTSGLLVPMEDTLALRDTLAKVLGTSAMSRRLAEAGRKRADLFDTVAIARRYVEAIHGAVEARRGQRSVSCRPVP